MLLPTREPATQPLTTWTPVRPYIRWRSRSKTRLDDVEGRLFSIDRKRDQGVARYPAPIAVAGVDIQHAVHNRRPRTLASRIGSEKKEDEHAGDRDVEPYREGVAGDLFVGLKLFAGRMVECGEDQGQGDNGEHDMADQDEKIQQPNRALAGKRSIAMKMVIDDITHQKEDRERQRGQHAAYMPFPIAALDIDEPAD